MRIITVTGLMNLSKPPTPSIEETAQQVQSSISYRIQGLERRPFHQRDICASLYLGTAEPTSSSTLKESAILHPFTATRSNVTT
jgi:hypothetical protein